MADGPNPFEPPNVPSVEPERRVVRVDDRRQPRVPGPVIVAALIGIALIYALISWFRYGVGP